MAAEERASIDDLFDPSKPDEGDAHNDEESESSEHLEKSEDVGDAKEQKTEDDGHYKLEAVDPMFAEVFHDRSVDAVLYDGTKDDSVGQFSFIFVVCSNLRCLPQIRIAFNIDVCITTPRHILYKDPLLWYV